jgi:hypothetical protein
MKKWTLLLSVLCVVFFSNTHAQISDTVSLQAGYSRMVWYSLENDEQANTPKNDWDIAFDLSNTGAAIWINPSTGTRIWKCACDTSQFESLDTSGISSWSEQYNTDTSWQYGAFNLNLTVPDFDLGWGTYSMITHTVIGDEVFVIKLANGTYQKVWIQGLASGIYTFRHASLDNAMDMVHTVDKGMYGDKNFVYYSLINHVAVDKEPLASDWDLVFQQYSAMDQGGYLVSGVLANYGVEVAEAYPVNNPATFNDWQNQNYQSMISTIGYDWKSYSSGWTLEDSLVFFVKDLEGSIWKLYFTGFGGSSNGNFIFSKEKLSTVGLNDNGETEQFFRIYPNPSDANVMMLMDAEAGNVSLVVSDIQGRNCISENFFHNGGLLTRSLAINNLTPGVYVLTVLCNGRVFQERIIKN